MGCTLIVDPATIETCLVAGNCAIGHIEHTPVGHAAAPTGGGVIENCAVQNVGDASGIDEEPATAGALPHAGLIAIPDGNALEAEDRSVRDLEQAPRSAGAPDRGPVPIDREP